MIFANVFSRAIDWTQLWAEAGIENSIVCTGFQRGLEDGHSAGGNSLTSVNFSADGHVLIVSGCIFDDITSLATTCDLVVMPNYYSFPSVSRPDSSEQEISILGNNYSDEEGLYFAIWRSLRYNFMPNNIPDHP